MSPVTDAAPNFLFGKVLARMRGPPARSANKYLILRRNGVTQMPQRLTFHSSFAAGHWGLICDRFRVIGAVGAAVISGFSLMASAVGIGAAIGLPPAFDS
jgi:hypothetical protein